MSAVPATNPSSPTSTPRGRIGIFGGTFDPIHIGHLILADEARYQLQLDCVYLAPAGNPPHKQDRHVTPIQQRLYMAELAAADVDYLKVSSIDAERPGPHYTVDMVRLLDQQVAEDAEIFFLMGLDSLRDLPAWYHAKWLVENCTLVALSRYAVELDWPRLEAALPGLRERVIILDMPELEIASHTIQARIRSGQPIRHQVPRVVEAYIYKHGLYRGEGSEAVGQ